MATNRTRRRNIEGTHAFVTTSADPAVAAYLASLPPLDSVAPLRAAARLVGTTTDGGSAWVVSKEADEAVEALL